VVFRRTKGTQGYENGRWELLPSGRQVIDLAVGGDGTAWAIADDHSIMYWTGDTWKAVDGLADRVAVDASGQPWIVNPDHQIWRRNKGATSYKDDGAWQLMNSAGRATDIAVGSSGQVFTIGTDAFTGGYGIWQYNAATSTRVRLGASGGAAAARVAVDANGLPWVVNSTGDLLRYWPAGDTFVGVGAPAFFEALASPIGLTVGINFRMLVMFNGQRAGIRRSATVWPHGFHAPGPLINRITAA